MKDEKTSNFYPIEYRSIDSRVIPKTNFIIIPTQACKNLPTYIWYNFYDYLILSTILAIYSF